MLSRDGDVVSRASSLEMDKIESTHLDGMIDELVVVGGFEAAESVGRRARTREARCNAPVAISVALRRDDLDLAGSSLVSDRPHENARPVEVSALAVQIRCTYRQIERVDLGDHRQRSGAWVGPPRILCALADADACTSAFGADRDEMSREFADEIASGNPGGQPERLAGWIGVVDSARHLEHVRVGIDGYDAIESGRHAARAGNGRPQL